MSTHVLYNCMLQFLLQILIVTQVEYWFLSLVQVQYVDLQ